MQFIAGVKVVSFVGMRNPFRLSSADFKVRLARFYASSYSILRFILFDPTIKLARSYGSSYSILRLNLLDPMIKFAQFYG